MTTPEWGVPGVPWVAAYESRWESGVESANWNRRDLGSGYTDWYKLLPCPRCTHQMSILVAPGAYRDSGGNGGRAGMVAASCNCPDQHEGRPQTRPSGCGYSAWINGPAPERAP